MCGVSLLYSDLHSFGYVPRSGIVVSYGSSVFSFYGTSTPHPIVVVLIYIPTDSVGRVPSPPPHPHQHLLFVWLIAILTRVRWNLNVILICFSFMVRNGEHFFMYLLAIWTSCFEHCSVHLPISSLDCWFFGCLVFWVPYKFWSDLRIYPCQMYSWQKIFSHSVGCLFSLVMVSFAEQKLFSIMRFHLSVLSLNCW
jgi:hypothetical protein